MGKKKNRQKKHRLLQRDFLNNLYKITKKGGKLFIKTDYKEYFEFILKELKETSWRIIEKSFDYEKDNLLLERDKITEFESKFRGERKKVCYLELEK